MGLRSLSRISLLVAVIMGLWAIAPAGGQRSPGPNEFPLAALWELVTTRPSWSFDRPLTPVQEYASGRGMVPESTRARGGSGRAPALVPGASQEHRPPAKRVGGERVTDSVPGFDPSTSRRLPEEASAAADAFRNADGSFTKMYSPGPRNFKALDGSWKPIDSNLVRDASGRWKVAADATGVSLAGDQPGRASGSPAAAMSAMAGDLASVTFPTGERAAYRLSGARAVEPVVTGPTARYQGILPETDLELTAFAGGLKETLILKSAGAETQWDFPLTLDGLTARMAANGSVELVGADGSVVAWFPRGFMEDSAVTGAGDGARSDGVRYELTTVDGQQALRVIADAAWIADPARVFPIEVDPTLSSQSEYSTYVQEPFTNDNSGSAALKTGYHSSGPYRAQTYLKFDAFTSSYHGYRISSATLRVHVIWSGSCPSTRASELQVWDVAGWHPSTLRSWAQRPVMYSQLGSMSGVPNATVCGNNSENPEVGQWWEIPLTEWGVSILNRWTSGGLNNGLSVATTLADNDTWKKLSSVHTTKKPVLVVNYAPNMAPQMESQYPPHGYGSATLTPELLATAIDPDGWPNAVTYKFEVRDMSNTVVAESPGTSIASRSWTVPSGALKWGQSYWWTVQAYDGIGWSAESWHVLSTPVPQPPITSGLSQNQDPGFAPNIGNYTSQTTDAQIGTAGPALAIERAYNSRDPRSGQAFGAGWSSILDASVSTRATGLVVTYPTGQDAAFGLNADGTYSPPPGRFATVRPLTQGYELVDKQGTKYAFTLALITTEGGGIYKLTSITDINGRALTLSDFDGGGHARKITSASGRSLHITWTTPAGSTTSRVETVTTDPAVPGDPSSAGVWRYTYSGDRLVKVCPPTSTVNCTEYAYGSSSLAPTAVLDAGPHLYLRLDEPAGTATAISSTVDSLSVGVGRYRNTGSAPGALPGTSAAAAVFNGTSSWVELSKTATISAKYQSISLRFKTTGSGVLFSRSAAALPGLGTGSAFNPVLYVGTDGKLRGELHNGTIAPLTSTAAVNDGAWHSVVLVADGTTQRLYLDGTQVGQPLSGEPVSDYSYGYVGSGQWTGWPATTGDLGYFNGQIADLALYTMPLTTPQVAIMHRTAAAASAPLTQVTRPSGGVQSKVEYHPTTGVVTKVTDANGGVWQIGQPTRGDAGQGYASAVLSAGPIDYFRLAGTGNELNGGTAAFNQVTVGVSGGPLGGGQQVSAFNGTSSWVKLPANDLSGTGNVSVSMWFKTVPGGTGVLYSQSTTALPAAAPGGWNPALYIGVDGKLRGEFWNGTVNPITTATPVNDGQWHHVALAATTNAQSMYLDGQLIGSLAGTLSSQGETHAYLGAGQWKYWPDSTGDFGYFKGQIAEFAFYKNVTLRPEQVHAQFAARDLSRSWQRLPNANTVTKGPGSVSVWFKFPAGDTSGGVIYGFQSAPVADPASPNWNPALYVGTDGKLRGELWQGGANPITTSTAVNDGQWHHAVLAAAADTQTLYLDGAAVGTLTGTIATVGTDYVYVGAGKWEGWPGSSGKVGYWPGELTELTFDPAQLTAAQVSTRFNAGRRPGAPDLAQPTGLPTKTVTVSDPAGGQVTQMFDLAAGGRQLERRDQRGYVTRFGYDTSGFLRSVTDQNGDMTITEHDRRGNAIAEVTCQDRSMNKCSTTHRAYSAEDRLVELRDGRSASATDNTYLTRYTYDANGNLTEVTDPLGRKRITEYTNGLPTKVTMPGGAVETTVYAANGDLAQQTDAAGLVTEFTYDGLGRVTKKKEISDTYPAGLITSYTYDELNRLVTTTEPGVVDRIIGTKTHTKATTVVYNVDGQVESSTVSDATGGDPSRVTSYGYNTLGQKASETDALNKTTLFEYDASGRAVKETHPDGTVHETVYDPMGKPVTRKLDSQVVETRAYDPAGRLATVTDAMGWQNHYAYTDNGLVATVTRKNPNTSASFVTESNVYDAAGHLISQVTNNGGTATTFTVDAAGRTTSEAVAGVGRTTAYTLGADDTIRSARVSDASGAQVVNAKYDAAGRKTSQTVALVGAGGPAGWWSLDGNALDVTPAGRHATAGAGVTWADGAAALAGPGHIRTSAPTLDTTQSHTVSAWTKITDTAGYYGAVAQLANVASGFFLGYDKGLNRWAFTAYNSDTANTGVTVAASTSAPVADTWVHLTGVRDTSAGTIKLYVNGAMAAIVAAPAPFAANGPLAIGAYQYNGDSSNHLKGSVDNVQVYQRALSAADVSALYGSGRGGNALASNTVTTSWQLDKRGLPKSQVDPNGNTTYFDYDQAGRLAVTTSPTVNSEENGTVVAAPLVESVSYNTFGETVEFRDARGFHSYAERDAMGQVTSRWLPAYTPPGASTPIQPVFKSAYDPVGRLIGTEDPLGKKTSYVYDQFGRVETVTAPDLGVTTYGYNLNGQLTSVTDPTGAKTEATYDFMGRQLTSTTLVRRTGQPTEAHTTTYGYNTAGWLASVTPPGRAATTFEYNAAGEMTKLTDAAGNATQFGYDFGGRRTVTTMPGGSKQTIGYDAAGRPVSQQRSSAAGTVLTTESATFDGNGNLLTLKDPRGTVSTFAYDAAGRLTQATQPVSATDTITTSFGYDAAGHRTRFTDGRGNAFTTSFNSLGLPESQVEPGGATFTRVYDAAGRIGQLRAPGGVTVDYGYDVMDRVTSTTGAGAEAATVARSFGYDLAGRMTSLSGPGGSNTLTYDDRGLLTAASGSSFTYTPDGRMASRVDAAGTTNYGYDNAGRLSSVSNVDTGMQLGYAYDAMSQVSQITYGGTGNRRVFGYDELHRLKTDELKSAGGTTIAKIAYGWDANSNLTSKATTGFAGSGTNTYTYDLANRLASWNNGTTAIAYGYDKSGNRTQAGGRTFTYNARNQLVSSSDGTTYAYSDRGTLRTTTVGTVSLETRADALGQVIRQYSSDTAYSEYEYDGLGRAIMPGFAYTGLGNDLASDGGASYVRGPEGEVLGTRVGGDARYAWTDLHSDLVGQFGATSASLTGSQAFDPFGKPISASGMQGSLGYQSEWTDAATKRVNMHARWYNPDTGAFDSRDTADTSPVPDSGRANRYTYAGGNPLTRVDPTGHDWMSNCNGWGSCLLQGFVNSFDVISIGKKIWGALSNIEQAVKQFAGQLAGEANHWRGKIRSMMPGAICNIWLVGKHICDGVATVGGWACALSGVCEIVQDCMSALSGGSANKCAEHVGEALAGALIGLVTGGVGAVGRHMAKNLLKKLNLPDPNKPRDGPDGGDRDRDERGRDRDRDPDNPPGVKPRPGKGKPGGGKPGAKRPGAGNGTKAPGGPRAIHYQEPKPPNTSQPRRSDPPCLTPTTGAPAELHSFHPATPVLMADGTTKPIADIEVGDKVTATDPATGETTAQPVTMLHLNIDHKLTTVTVATTPEPTTQPETGEGNGDRSTRGPTTATLHTTQNHPFWDAARSEWVNAADLTPGQSRLLTPDGQHLDVVAVANHTGHTEMRDLTVAVTHAYYVIAGDQPVLVHNNDVRNCDGPSQQAIRLWVPKRPGVDHEFQGLVPKRLQIRKGGNLQNGQYHYVVMPGGSVRAFHESIFDIVPSAGHTSLSRGPVAMAGTFNVDAGGNITHFGEFSGHFRPETGPANHVIAADALMNNGFDVSLAKWVTFAEEIG